jgi:hypothetical protein
MYNVGILDFVTRNGSTKGTLNNLERPLGSTKLEVGTDLYT